MLRKRRYVSTLESCLLSAANSTVHFGEEVLGQNFGSCRNGVLISASERERRSNCFRPRVARCSCCLDVTSTRGPRVKTSVHSCTAADDRELKWSSAVIFLDMVSRGTTAVLRWRVLDVARVGVGQLLCNTELQSPYTNLCSARHHAYRDCHHALFHLPKSNSS